MGTKRDPVVMQPQTQRRHRPPAAPRRVWRGPGQRPPCSPAHTWTLVTKDVQTEPEAGLTTMVSAPMTMSGALRSFCKKPKLSISGDALSHTQSES